MGAWLSIGNLIPTSVTYNPVFKLWASADGSLALDWEFDSYVIVLMIYDDVYDDGSLALDWEFDSYICDIQSYIYIRRLIGVKIAKTEDFLHKMFAIKLPPKPYYQSDTLGVSDVNSHLVSIVKALEELRVMTVVAKERPRQITEAHWEILWRHAAETFEWTSPDSFAISQLEMSSERTVAYGGFFADHLKEVDCTNLDDLLTRSINKVPREKETGAYLYMCI